MNTVNQDTRLIFRHPLVSQPLRTFANLDLASNFIDRLTRNNRANYQFNIQRTQANEWVVCRVISGGVQ